MVRNFWWQHCTGLPNGSKENDTRLNQSIVELSQDRTHVLIVGDFNHPEADWESELSTLDLQHKASVFSETVLDAFLYRLVKKPTHVKHISGEFRHQTFRT